MVSHGVLEAALYIKGDKVYFKYAAETTYPGIPEAYREINYSKDEKALSLTVEQIKELIRSLIKENMPELPGGIVLPELDEGTEVAVKLEKLYNEKIVPVLETKKAELDEKTEKSISMLKKTALDITEENGNIVIKTSASKMKAFNNELYTMTIDKLIDKYAGEGTFAKIKKDVTGLLDYTVGDILEKMNEYGVSEDDLFAFLNECATAIKGEETTIDELLGMKAGDLRAKLDEEKDTKILDLIKKGDSSFDETAIRQGLGVAFALMESSTAYDIVATIVNGTASDGDAKFDKKATKEKVDCVLDLLGKVFETTLTLDASGNFKSLNLKVTIDEEAMGMLSDIIGKASDEDALPAVTASASVTVLKGEFINVAKYDYDAMADAIDKPAEEEVTPAA